MCSPAPWMHNRPAVSMNPLDRSTHTFISAASQPQDRAASQARATQAPSRCWHTTSRASCCCPTSRPSSPCLRCSRCGTCTMSPPPAAAAADVIICMCLSLAKHLLTVWPVSTYMLVPLTHVFRQPSYAAGDRAAGGGHPLHRRQQRWPQERRCRPGASISWVYAIRSCSVGGLAALADFWPWRHMHVRLGQSMISINVDVSSALQQLELALHLQSTGCGRHVFRLLRVAARNNHPIPWLLLENVRPLTAAD